MGLLWHFSWTKCILKDYFFSNLPIFLTTKQCNYAVVSICLCHYMYTLVCHCKFLFAKHNRAYLIPILPAVKLSFSLCITVLIQRKQLSSRSMRQTFSIISSLLWDWSLWLQFAMVKEIEFFDWCKGHMKVVKNMPLSLSSRIRCTSHIISHCHFVLQYIKKNPWISYLEFITLRFDLRIY